MKIRFASINQQKIREVREILEPSGIEVKPFPIRIEELRTEDLYQLVSDKLLVAFKMIGKTLVMTVGGASGPLYGSFFLAAGEALSHDKQLPDDLADVFGSAVNAVSARGRSQVGEKTMLDVLVPVLETLKTAAGQPDLIARVRAAATDAVERTAPMQATKGRASFLGARSVGHVDPGARSSCVLVQAVCAGLEARA